MISKNKDKIKILLSRKLEEKLENNLHYSDGLLKVWNWAGFFSENFKLTFDHERGLFNEKTEKRE